MNITNREISFYVGSQDAIKALGSHVVRSKLVKECRSSLAQLQSVNSVRICWVPGHADLRGNEEADRLARFGSDPPKRNPP
ncbi:RNase H family protein [Streptomyces sp. IBSBF 2390]|uniref:RNase H family protein n=1 Tax=Streptomyces sp. IBSBF 2390 TaxID=2903533 RepID=UPI003FA789E9